MARLPHVQMPAHWVALALGLWCTVALNQAWWGRLAVLAAEQQLSGMQKLLAAAVLTAATTLWFLLTSWRGIRMAAWGATLTAAAVMQHFMLGYGALMDSSMLRNTLATNPAEAAALLSPALLGQVLLYAAAPMALLAACVRIPVSTLRRNAGRAVLLAVACVATVVAGSMLLYKPMAPLVRNHTEVRYLINPLSGITSLANVTLKPLLRRPRPFQAIAGDAALGVSYGPAPTNAAAPGTAPAHKPPLLVLVVGETTRSDHFGLNGYPRNTTPQMEARNVISWRNVRSCGTNTLASVPCMFSHLGKEAFEGRRHEYENLLDVLQHAGLQVDWLDNQSGCKDVCNRVAHAQAAEVASPAAVQRWCKDGECLDQLMVELLDERLASAERRSPAAGVVLVLHQMGSHGPAYYRRSSREIKQFLPECSTHVTSDCHHAALVNVYDNSMLETDLFVARTIDWLRAQQDRYETGLVYLSDHGESLGENGLYLHGLPYLIAPDVQKIVPWVLWPGSLLARTQVAESCVRAGIDRPLTHDNFFHTVLGLMDVRSSTYRPALDALGNCRPAPHDAPAGAQPGPAALKPGARPKAVLQERGAGLG